MKARKLLVAALACLAASACRTDPNTMLLERELRRQEDKIYELKDALEDCRAENSALHGRLDEGGRTPHTESGAGGRSRGPRTSAPPAEAAPTKPPVIELPSEALPEGEIPERLRVPQKRGGPSSGPSSREPAPAGKRAASMDKVTSEAAGPVLPGLGEPVEVSKQWSPAGVPPVALVDSQQAAAIVLNRRMSGGYNAGGRSGDDGVTLVVEPRDAQGRFVAAPAEVTVVAIDPAVQGPEGRIARWEFTPQETAALMRGSATDSGIHMQMLWPNQPPKHNDLHLFVRYTTSDGRRLEAEAPIRVALPGDRTAGRWTPSEPPPPVPQNSRLTEPWRPARETAPADSPPLRTATRPWPHKSEPADSPRPQRPVWSPNRE